jgi:hypothetical protein
MKQITIEQLRYIVGKQYERIAEKSTTDKFMDRLEMYRRNSKGGQNDLYDMSSQFWKQNIMSNMQLPPINENDMLYIDKTPKL